MANYKSSYGNIYDRCTKKSFSHVRGKPRNGQLAQLGSFHQSWPKVMRMGSTISQTPPPPHPPIPTSPPLSGYVRARYSLATLGFKCQEKQNKQVEKLKRGQKQRVNIIRVVNNEKIC